MAVKKAKEMRTPEEWGKIYEQEYNVYKEYTTKLRSLIEELLKKNKIEPAQIEHRTKEIKSFVEKIKREGKDYEDPLKQITDLVGIRVIAYYKEDLDKINKIIEKEFGVDWDNSSDKSKLLDPDRFGYLSVHYVIFLSSDRRKLPEWEDYTNIKAEIQVRTVMQHAWSTIDHKLRYKNKIEVPKDLSRQLFRLSALLELADEQFSDLRKRTEELEKSYTQKVEKGKLDIDIDFFSLNTYLRSKEKYLHWEAIAEEVGFRPLKEIKESPETRFNRRIGATSTLLKILGLTEVTTIKELDVVLQDASEWAREVLSLMCKISQHHGFTPVAMSHDVITLLVLYYKRTIVNDEIIDETNFASPLKKAIEEVTKNK